LDKRKFALSKIQANKIPPLTEPFIVDEETLYAYFSNTLNSEDSDSFSRNRAKVSTPKPIKNLYKLFEKCTPEENSIPQSDCCRVGMTQLLNQGLS
jgi:hypothetical protein